MRKYAIVMDDHSRWDGDAEFAIEAVFKSEEETGKKARYFVEPADIEIHKEHYAPNDKNNE